MSPSSHAAGAIVKALAAAACVLLSMSAQSRPAVDLIIRNARIVHGDGRVTDRATIGIAAGRIAYINTTPAPGADGGGSADLVPVERQIDAAGRTVLPGLIDAHVHADPWTLPVFLKYGVTSIRDLHSDGAVIFPLAKDDRPDHPRILTSGPMIDGRGSFWKNAVQVSDIGDARAAVRRLIDQGAGVIKVYTRIDPALISAIAAEAHARGVPVAAHLGFATATQAADAGIDSLEHLSGVAESASADPERLLEAHEDFLGGWTAFELEWQRIPFQRFEEVARYLIARGVVIVPTLTLHEAFSRMADKDIMGDPALADVPDRVLNESWNPADIMGRAKWTAATLDAFKQTLPILHRFVARYVSLGGRVVAGTDSPQQFVVPGSSLHREMELLVRGGLSPAQAIGAATLEAATLLGIQERVGTVAAGKIADLVILDGDPLADIRNSRKVWAVIKGGVVVRSPQRTASAPSKGRS